MLCLHHIGTGWMIGAGWHKLVRSQNRVEPHAVQIVCPLAVPELFQFSGIGPRQPHRKAAFGGMSSDHEVLHMSPFIHLYNGQKFRSFAADGIDPPQARQR
jgi:hypothetical protein